MSEINMTATLRKALFDFIIIFAISFSIFNVLPLQYKQDWVGCRSISCPEEDDLTRTTKTEWVMLGGYHLFTEEFTDMTSSEALRHEMKYQLSNTAQVWISLLISITASIGIDVLITRMIFSNRNGNTSENL
jgi:hypothetical protein